MQLYLTLYKTQNNINKKINKYNFYQSILIFLAIHLSVFMQLLSVIGFDKI